MLRAFFCFLWAVLNAYAGVASSHGAEHGINWWHLGLEYKDQPALGWLIITFLIFVYGICRAIKKPLSLYLETRSKDIKRQIEEGAQAKKLSEQKLKMYEEKLKTLDSEVEKMKSVFTEQAQAEKKERQRLAKEAELRILKEAEDSIKASFERSKNRLAEEVIKTAVALAEETITKKKRDQIDGLLQGAFIEDLKAGRREVH